VSIPVDTADDVGGQRSARVLAQILSLRTNLGELGGDGVGDRRVDRTGQINE
jgi:hypothetical protein